MQGLELLRQLEQKGIVARVLHVPKGETIYHQGEISAAICVLLNGKVELVLSASDGRGIGIAVLSPGAVFGELALTRAERFVTARALTDVKVGLLNAEEVRLQGKVDPRLFDEILDLMGERLLTAVGTVTELLSAPLSTRLARWLLELATEKGDSHSLQLDITQEELAALVGGSREAVNRELRRLAGRGWLALGRRRIVITQPDELRAHAGPSG